MKKILTSTLLLFLITSCSQIWKQDVPKIEKISIWKYETPNWNNYELIKFWTWFLFKNTDWKTDNKTYSSTWEIQKYLISQNPLLTTEYVSIFWNKYKISNYKWINITDDTWKKIDKVFSANIEAMKYLESLDPQICDITIKSFIPNSPNYDNLDVQFKQDVKKFAWKNKIVSFETVWDCKWWKVDLVSDKSWKIISSIPWISWNQFKYNDTNVSVAISSSEWWFWPWEWWDGWSDNNILKWLNIKNTIIDEIKDNPNWFKWKIISVLLSNWEYMLSLDIWNILLTQDKLITKDEMLQVSDNLKLIWRTLSISAESPIFNWDNISGITWNVNNQSKNKDIVLTGGWDSWSVVIFESNWISKTIDTKILSECWVWDVSCYYKWYDKKTNSIIIDMSTFYFETQKTSPSKTYYINVKSWKSTPN